MTEIKLGAVYSLIMTGTITTAAIHRATEPGLTNIAGPSRTTPHHNEFALNFHCTFLVYKQRIDRFFFHSGPFLPFFFQKPVVLLPLHLIIETTFS